MHYIKLIKRGGRRYKLKLHVVRKPIGKVVLRVKRRKRLSRRK